MHACCSMFVVLLIHLLCVLFYRELTDITILESFIHLRYVDLSKNNLRDISTVGYLSHLLTVKLDFNKLQSAKLEELPFLQTANFSNNKLKTTEGCSHPLLEHLIMNCKTRHVIIIIQLLCPVGRQRPSSWPVL